MAEEKKDQEIQEAVNTVDELLGMLESDEQKGALQEFFTRLRLFSEYLSPAYVV